MKGDNESLLASAKGSKDAKAAKASNAFMDAVAALFPAKTAGEERV